MDFLDKKILNRIQANFPLASRPYKVIADELGISEDQVMSCVFNLKKSGIIRRIGGNFVPTKVGFVSTLCAARVSLDKIKNFSKVVNSFPGVTHNYIRNNKYNVWFTFIAKNKLTIRKNLQNIINKTKVSPIMNLPANRVFKVRAEFNL